MSLPDLFVEPNDAEPANDTASDLFGDEAADLDLALFDAFGAPSLGAGALDPTGLIRPIGKPFALSAEVSDRADSVRWELDDATFDCVAGDRHCTLNAAMDAPGHHTVILRADASDGADGSATTKMVVYVPLAGGDVEVADPEAAPQPFPALPVDLDSDASTEAVTNALTDGCPGCDLCADPLVGGQPLAVLGSADLRSWWQNGAVIIGFNSADVVVGAGFSYSAVPGRNGAAPGEDGKVSRGFGVATYTGRIVLCGGTFRGANGGAGAANNGAGCNETTRGGRGMPWFGVLFTAPEGAISYCGELRCAAPAVAQAVQRPTPRRPSVPRAPRAARPRPWVVGEASVAAVSPTWPPMSATTAPTPSASSAGTHLGGVGGDATASATTPAPCLKCNKYAGRGGRAEARGGRGGRSAWYFVTHPDYAPEPEDIVGHLFGAGTYVGGSGGSATATAGDGGDSNCVGCTGSFAWSGRGGEARAIGGNGAFGMSGRGVRGAATATSGAGGAAVATPNPAVAAAGCPGARGCSLVAKAGNSGRVTARAGRGAGPRVETPVSGVAGDATATGGDGGAGVGCPDCDGGPGGRARALAGRDVDGQPFRLDGMATANGGSGGTGSTCCDPDADGGEGGRGGRAIAAAYKKGFTAGAGGNGGNGGNGVAPGGRGTKGLGMGVPKDIPTVSTASLACYAPPSPATPAIPMTRTRPTIPTLPTTA